MSGDNIDEDKPIIMGISNKHKNPLRITQTEINHKHLMGATLNAPRTVFTKSQLGEMADAYVNDGIMRRCVNILVQGVKGKRVKFVVEPNEEISGILSDAELEALNNQTTTKDRVPELKRKQIRIDKRCRLNDRLDIFLKNFFVFGRALQGIVRYPTTPEFPRYGEPRALLPYNVTNILNIEVDPVTYELDGIEYDFGIDKGKKILRPLDFIFGVNDDNNLYNNTNYSGVSPVWTCLSTSQSNVIINDEDIPESTKQLAHKFGLLYAGTSKKSVIENIRNQLEMGAWIVHNQQGLTADVHDLARDLTELPRVREYNAKYMSMSMMVPMFLLFEDTANFATANQALQAWRATTLDYYRTLLQGILEQYWYDPLLADHFDVDIQDVISLRVKMKPVFEDLIFDTYKDSVEAVTALVNAGILTEEQALEKLGEDKFLQQRKELEAELLRQREEDLAAREEMLAQQQRQQGNSFNSNINRQQNQNQNQKKTTTTILQNRTAAVKTSIGKDRYGPIQMDIDGTRKIPKKLFSPETLTKMKTKAKGDYIYYQPVKVTKESLVSEYKGNMLTFVKSEISKNPGTFSDNDKLSDVTKSIAIRANPNGDDPLAADRSQYIIQRRQVEEAARLNIIDGIQGEKEMSSIESSDTKLYYVHSEARNEAEKTIESSNTPVSGIDAAISAAGGDASEGGGGGGGGEHCIFNDYGGGGCG